MPKFLNNIDLEKNQLLNAVIHVASSPPLQPNQGQIFFDSVSDQMQICTVGYDASTAAVWEGIVTEVMDGANQFNSALKIGRNSQNLIDFATTDNKIIFRVNDVDELELVENALQPTTTNGIALGTSSLMWSDLFLASGSVINFNAGDVTLTHSSNTLTVAGGTLATEALTTTTIATLGTVTVGVDDTGHDVKFFGATTGKYMLWDESEDQLNIQGSLNVTSPITIGSVEVAGFVHPYSTTITRTYAANPDDQWYKIMDTECGCIENVKLSITHDGNNTHSLDEFIVSFATYDFQANILRLPGARYNTGKLLEIRTYGTTTGNLHELWVKLGGMTDVSVNSGTFTVRSSHPVADLTTQQASAPTPVAGDAALAFNTTDKDDITLQMSGGLKGASLDISGDIDVDGTSNLDNVDIDGTTQMDGTVTVGVNDTGHTVTFYGDTAGSSFKYNSTGDEASILVPGDQTGLTVYTTTPVGGANDFATVPTFKVGRDSGQYWGTMVADNSARLIHRQDEAAGDAQVMFTSFELWNDTGANDYWRWVTGTDAGASISTVAQLDRASKFSLRLDSSVLAMGAGDDITLTHNGSTGGTLASAGNFIVDSTGGTLTLDGNSGVSIAGGSSEIDITTTGILDLNSASLDVDTSGAISLDSSAGSIDMNVVDGQTISIGLSGATEMVFTPHGTASSEKISIINTSGNADDAIKLDSVAGGILIDAGSTNNAAIDIKSAGGIDITSAGATKNIDITSTGGRVLLLATEDSANAIYLRANGGTSETVKIHSDQGTGVGAIELLADAGGIDINAGTTIDIDANGALTLDSGASISIGTNADHPVSIDSTTFALDASSTVAIDGTGVSIDGTLDSNLTVTGSGKDLDLRVEGGGAQELRLASEGTGASAVKISTVTNGGSIDIDSEDNITIDAADRITLTTADTGAEGKISLVSATTGSNTAIHLDGNGDGSAIVDIDAGVLDIDVTGAATLDTTSLTVTSPIVTFTSPDSGDPVVSIVNTNDDANGATLKLQKIVSTGGEVAVNDVLGSVSFYGGDSSNNETEYARIQAKEIAQTNASEQGKLTLGVATTTSGAIEDVLTITGGVNALGSTVAIAGNLTVAGTTTTVNSTTVDIADKNLTLGNNLGGDTEVDGGGFTLQSNNGDKTWNWISSTNSWTSNQHIDIVSSGTDYKIAGTSVLSATVLGSSVVTSSLTTVGTIGNGIWQGNDVGVEHGGTGRSTLDSNAVLVGNGTSDITSSTNLSFDDTDLTIGGAGKMKFRDNELYINSSADSQLDIVSNSIIELTAPSVTISVPSGSTSTDSVLNVHNIIGNNPLRIHAGESYTYSSLGNTQTGEIIYCNAEGGLQINSSPNNWISVDGNGDPDQTTQENWDDRHTATICNTSGNSNFPGEVEALSLDINGVADISGVATLASLVCTDAATFGGGYGYTGATISTAGIGTFNGALTTDGVLTGNSLVCTLGATFDGNVGIGTTAPNSSLHIVNTTVTSDGDGTASDTASGQDSIMLYGHGGVDEATYGGITWMGGVRRRAMITAVAENTDSDYVGLAFYTQGPDGAGDFLESMRISSNGKIGIGVAAPTQALDVSGNINSSGKVVGTTFQPDGDTTAGDNAAIGYEAADGLVLTGQGTTGDVTIRNDADALVMHVPTGTQNVVFAGTITSAGFTAPQAKSFVLHHDTADVAAAANGTTDSLTFAISHGFAATRLIKAEILVNSGNYDTVFADITRTDDNTMVITFATAVANGAYVALLTRIG
jgi:hypothetical protein